MRWTRQNLPLPQNEENWPYSNMRLQLYQQVSINDDRSQTATLIESLIADLPNLDAPLNDFAITLKTRAILASSIEQHQAGVNAKRVELERQRRLLQQDEDIRRNLKDVRIGLEAKKARLIQKEEEAQDQGSALQLLRLRVATVETSLGRFLAAVIEICDSLYDDRNKAKREQLKHLIDVSSSVECLLYDSISNFYLKSDSSMRHGTLPTIHGSTSMTSISLPLSPFSSELTSQLRIPKTLEISALSTFIDRQCTIMLCVLYCYCTVC